MNGKTCADPFMESVTSGTILFWYSLLLSAVSCIQNFACRLFEFTSSKPKPDPGGLLEVAWSVLRERIGAHGASGEGGKEWVVAIFFCKLSGSVYELPYQIRWLLSLTLIRVFAFDDNDDNGLSLVTAMLYVVGDGLLQTTIVQRCTSCWYNLSCWPSVP